jgi:hypothetical protein
MAVQFLGTDAIYNFEQNIEEAAKNFLSTNITEDIIFTTLRLNDLVMPRVSISFELGEALDPPDLKNTSSSLLDYRKYTGILSLQIATDSSIDPASSGGSSFENNDLEHAKLRAKIRNQMRLSLTNWDALSTNYVKMSGAGSTQVNTIYEREATDVNGKASYRDVIGSFPRIRFGDIKSSGSNKWQIYIDGGLFQTLLYESPSQSPAYPWQVTDWETVSPDGSVPVPSVDQWRALPFYDVNYCRPTSTEFNVDESFSISELNYEMNFVIRNDVL